MAAPDVLIHAGLIEIERQRMRQILNLERNRCAHLAAQLALLALPSVVFGQAETAQPLNTVVITGKLDTATQASIETARDHVHATPGGASVVDLNQVREGRQSTWSDSLGLAPGVFIQDRFGSEEARMSIRGSALSRTYHSFGTKVMQDGVPINYADGFFDMQTVDPNASRYVEVLRGPNATTDRKSVV